ncbi:MAG: hypothetical protein K5696_08010 [Lachnospiraceae bacterium]|nr:hypothetical protein [Lachnospiraceae bacterium]
MGDEKKSADQLHEMADRAVAEIAEDADAFTSYLHVVTRLYAHGSENQLLAWSQRRDAAEIAGIRNWKEQGHPVKDGENPLWILFPDLRYVTGSAVALYSEDGKVRMDDKNRILYERDPMFTYEERAIPVYDIAQTEAEMKKEPESPFGIENAVHKRGFVISLVKRTELPEKTRDGYTQGEFFYVAEEARSDANRYFKELIRQFTDFYVPVIIRDDKQLSDSEIPLLSQMVQRCLINHYLGGYQEEQARILLTKYTSLPAGERRRILKHLARCYRKILLYLKGQELSFTGTCAMNGLLDSGIKPELEQILREAEKKLPEKSETKSDIGDLYEQLDKLENDFLEKLYVKKLNQKVLYASPPMKLPVEMDEAV